ncbi:hypothetical protein CCR94_02285 [Rhodoblastus sphagnicola]|uniref:Uncharacterized protein n=1 Tax=Rhodoblastus sphagnicola TaxID=333368 RepID=A0A2S6NF81_9HYPH|nr:hypothetical protein [Rhodoblastus sphagnicola]MBB4200212.1 hypothetical protein [Rhodoblastus sphagnicola]PPQ33250.1 hypothetical protein CCR94_02285 [Rhodoblastus sphagnicola]
MSDTAPPRVDWLDLPQADDASILQAIPVDTEAAFARVADQFCAVNEPQVSSLADYLSVDPGRARFEKVTRPLSAARAKALLRRMTAAGTAPSSSALPDHATAPLAHKALLSRILNLSRIAAMQRACAAASTTPFNGGQF